jgi:transcriptional regulator with XRE-family HTH domain
MTEHEVGNLPRTEEFLAQRIEELRTKQGWSFADLSQRMGDVGCPIERSSLQKIERGKPRRKITVNELVAFSQVFHVTIPDLLVSPSYGGDRMFLQDVKDGPVKRREYVEARRALDEVIQRVVASCLDPERGKDREAVLRRDHDHLASLGASETVGAGPAENGDPNPYGRGDYDKATQLSEWYAYYEFSQYEFLNEVLEKLARELRGHGKGK